MLPFVSAMLPFMGAMFPSNIQTVKCLFELLLCHIDIVTVKNTPVTDVARSHL